MFQDIANILITANKSKFELRALEESSFQLDQDSAEDGRDGERRSECC